MDDGLMGKMREETSSAECANKNIANGEYCKNSPFNQIKVIGIAKSLKCLNNLIYRKIQKTPNKPNSAKSPANPDVFTVKPLVTTSNRSAVA